MFSHPTQSSKMHHRLRAAEMKSAKSLLVEPQSLCLLMILLFTPDIFLCAMRRPARKHSILT